MSTSNLHINPIAPDPSASGRYGASEERAHRDHSSHEEAPLPSGDRLEISDDARETFLSHVSGPDLNFARKALEKAPPLPDTRIAQIIDRIETGYYAVPGVLMNISIRMMPVLR